MNPANNPLLTGLLDCSTALMAEQKQKGEGNDYTPEELTQEKKDWLNQALSAVTVNPIDEMKKCIKVLEEETDEERREEAIQTLTDWCEDINLAIDFEKIGGFALLPALFQDSDHAVRSQCCELVGALAQNNPYCQEKLIHSKAFESLFERLQTDSSDNVKVKAMFAISCLTRDSDLGQASIADDKCFDILIATAASPIEKLQLKCVFLFSSICRNDAIKNKLIAKGFVRTLISIYANSQATNQQVHEYLLVCVRHLIDNLDDIDRENNAEKSVKQAREPGVDFKNILQRRLAVIKDDPQFIEEKELAMHIYNVLFK